MCTHRLTVMLLRAGYLPFLNLNFCISKNTDKSTLPQGYILHGICHAQKLIYHRVSVNINVSPFTTHTNMTWAVICSNDM